MLLEAALRALVAAAILWTGLRLLRVRNVPAQKTAWGLVLAVALAMPLIMRVPLPAWAQLRVPALVLPPALLTAPVADSAAAADFSSSATLAATSSSLATDPSNFASVGSPFDPATAPPASGSLQASIAKRAAGIPEPAAVFDPPLRVAVERARGSAPVSEPFSPSLSAALVRSAAMPAVPPVSPAPQALRPYAIRGLSLAALSPLQWLWSLYLVVSAALLLRLALGVGSSLRLWMRARPVEIPGHASVIPVRASAHIASPVNIGSGIVLPAGFEAWDEEKLRIVLAHESSHVRQRDFYLQVFAGLYAALLWFSPLGWWLKRKLSELGEAISDRAALEAAPSPSDYAQLLLEFAALPHLPRTGVAMAHANNLSARIERLLNDTAFHQSFAGRRRAVAALLLAPIALLASTALVRVHAAENPRAVLLQAAPPQQDAPSQPDAIGQSHPDQSHPDSSPVNGADAAQQMPPQAEPAPAAPAPPAPPAADVAPAAPPAPPSADVAPAAPPAPPEAPSQDAVAPWPAIVIPDINIPPIQLSAVKIPAINIPAIEIPAMPGMNGRLFVWDGGGACDACALVGDPGTAPHFFGGSSDADDYNQEIEKARKQAHGHFFWFQKDDKSYIVDDPAIVSQIEAMVASMENLRHQIRDLAKQERGIGAQERAAAQDAREQARKQAAAAQNIPKPDLTEALAQLNAAADSLKNAQGDTVTRQQLAELQRKLSELQSKVIASETRVNLAALYNNADWTKYTQQMNEYGAQMGALGSQIGSKAKEEHSKIESIIDDSVKSGKAQPVN
jgi:Zn-dependent protease with chaperone function